MKRLFSSSERTDFPGNKKGKIGEKVREKLMERERKR